MKNIPKRIYLPVSEDREPFEGSNWYRERTDDTYLEYVLVEKGKIPETEDVLAKILRVICDENNVKIDDVKGKTRDKELVTARRVYCYFACQLTKKSLNGIGAEIRKDHALVLYHKKKIESWLDMGKYSLKEKLELIEERLKL